MKPEHRNDSQILPTRQLTPGDFVRLVDALAPEAESMRWRAHWRTGYDNDGESVDELRDDSSFQDFDKLETVGLTFYYGSRERVNVDLIVGRANLRWAGAIGADKARRFRQVWEALPQSRLRTSRWTTVMWMSLLVVGVILSTSGVALSLQDRFGLWASGGALVFYIAGLLTQRWKYRGDARRRAALSQPFVLERLANQWSDEKHRTNLAIAIAGIVLSVLVGVGGIVATILTAGSD